MMPVVYSTVALIQANMKSPELMDGGHVDSTDGGSLCTNEMSFMEDGGHVSDEVKAILAKLEQ